MCSLAVKVCIYLITEQIKHQLSEPFVGGVPVVFAVPEQIDGDQVGVLHKARE